MSPVILVPHVGHGGGAGLYIKQVKQCLESCFDVSTAGRHAGDYGALQNIELKGLENLLYVNYAGVSWFKKLYYLFRLILNCVICIFSLFPSRLDFCDPIFVLTSGIQMPMAWGLKKIYPKSKVVILIQENWLLDRDLYGYISKIFLMHADLVVSITKCWARYAENRRIISSIYRNNISPPLISNPVVEEDVCYDALYVGGGQKIKGFKSIIELFVKVSSFRQIKICIAGDVNASDRLLFEKVNAAVSNGSALIYVGAVDSIFPFLHRSKLLLLPISAPHFLRPAIEAGFCARTFLLTNFSSEDDYSIPGVNCLCFNGVDDFAKKFVLLLEDSELRYSLGQNNRAFAEKYVLDNSEKFSCSNFKKCIEVM